MIISRSKGDRTMKKVIRTIFVFLFVTVFMAVSVTASNNRDPIAAADFHHLCADSIMNCDESEVLRTSCPRCGASLHNVCSGQYVLNSENGLTHSVPCYVTGHPSGCATIQRRCYTDVACTNYSCHYYVSGSNWHVESYYHELVPSVYDDFYCSLPKTH